MSILALVLSRLGFKDGVFGYSQCSLRNVSVSVQTRFLLACSLHRPLPAKNFAGWCDLGRWTYPVSSRIVGFLIPSNTHMSRYPSQFDPSSVTDENRSDMRWHVAAIFWVEDGPYRAE